MCTENTCNMFYKYDHLKVVLNIQQEYISYQLLIMCIYSKRSIAELLVNLIDCNFLMTIIHL